MNSEQSYAQRTAFFLILIKTQTKHTFTYCACINLKFTLFINFEK